MPQIGLKDVAREAGVAFSTVSMALRGNEKINPKTRKRISDIADRLGYLPNAAARNLVRSKTNSIGIVIAQSRNSTYMEYVMAVEQQIIKLGYKFRMFLADIHQSEQQKYLLDEISGMVDGLICYPLVFSKWGYTFQEKLKKLGIKYVFTRYTGDGFSDWVSVDHFKSGCLVGEYLVKKGHKKIATFRCKSDFEEKPGRFQGILQTLEKHDLNLDCRVSLNKTIGSYREGYELAKEMLDCKPRPTALFMRSDFLATAAVRVLSDMGLQAGKDVDVVGYDNTEAGAYSVPALTTVNCNYSEQARLLCEILLTRISGDDSPPQNIVIEPKLIIRESA